MQQEILFEVHNGQYGNVGMITLNRPKALNALTENMCIKMYEQLKAWEGMNDIKAVIVQGVGDRAFCAGGDIRTIYEGREDASQTIRFFEHEYLLNALIYHYPKPYFAIMDGIVMGGGLGISACATYRIVTERSMLAMPETNIGFFPDVGGSYFLPRLLDNFGYYIALTGNPISGSDAVYIGLADEQIASDRIPAFVEAIINSDHENKKEIESAISCFNKEKVSAKLNEIHEVVNACFSAGMVEEILSDLEKHGSSQSIEIYECLLARSPTSLKVTLEAMRTGQQMGFDECIQRDLNISYQFLKGKDFYEGVRATLIDKDKNPQWNPKTLAEISWKDVSNYLVEK